MDDPRSCLLPEMDSLECVRQSKDLLDPHRCCARGWELLRWHRARGGSRDNVTCRSIMRQSNEVLEWVQCIST